MTKQSSSALFSAFPSALSVSPWCIFRDDHSRSSIPNRWTMRFSPQSANRTV